MQCIQCGCSKKECNPMRHFTTMINNPNGYETEKAHSFLCRSCASCTKCRNVCTFRPSKKLPESEKPIIQNIPPRNLDRRQKIRIGSRHHLQFPEYSVPAYADIPTVMSVPWECLECAPCKICGMHDLFKKGNCHVVCCKIWCIWKLGKSDISHFPKDMIRFILQTMWKVDINLLNYKE